MFGGRELGFLDGHLFDTKMEFCHFLLFYSLKDKERRENMIISFRKIVATSLGIK